MDNKPATTTDTGDANKPALAPFRPNLHPLVQVSDRQKVFVLAELPPDGQRELWLWQAIISDILKTPRNERGALKKQLASEHGVTVKQIEYRMTRFNKGSRGRGNLRFPAHSWRALVDWNKYKPTKPGTKIPQAFIDLFHEQVTNATRENDAVQNVVKRLIRQAKRWAQIRRDENKIPGYHLAGQTPGPGEVELTFNPRTGIPDGWSYGNLIKKQPEAHIRVALRGGPRQAARFKMPVLRTRVGLRFRQVVMFDDQDFDTRVIPLFGDRLVTPQSFADLDVLTGYSNHLIKCPYHDDRAGVLRTLTQKDFFWRLIWSLTQEGWNDSGVPCLWIMEHGTANVEGMDELIKTATRGAVTFQRSGIFNKPAYKGLFGASPGGNPRFKAHIESSFKPLRILLADAPGAKHHTERTNELAQRHGREMEYRRLLRIADEMEPEFALQLVHDHMHYPTFAWLAQRMVEMYNRNPDHQLEGWRSCHFSETRYRLEADDSSPFGKWFSPAEMQALPTDRREALRAVGKSMPNCEKVFNLSRWEARQRMLDKQGSEIRKLRDDEIPMVAPSQLWRDERVEQDHTIRITDHWIDADEMVYPGYATNSHGGRENLPRGEKLKVLLSPFDPSKIWVAQALPKGQIGRVIGTCPRIKKSMITDEIGITKQLAEIAEVEAPEVAAVEAMAAREIARNRNNRRFNDALYTADENAKRDRMKEAGEIDRQKRTPKTSPKVPVETDENPLGI
jgi:hypothetical protein